MKPSKTKESQLFYEALLTLQTPEECRLFLEDICTIKELQAMVQRYQVACMLDKQMNYSEITDQTGASSATICRVNKCLVYGDGGYRIALDRLKEKDVSQG